MIIKIIQMGTAGNKRFCGVGARKYSGLLVKEGDCTA